MRNNSIFVARIAPATTSATFQAWVSPGTLVAPVTRIEADAAPGGHLTIWAGNPTEVMRGGFIEVDEPSRLYYTWRWGDDPEESVVVVTFRAIDTRATLIEVTHSGFLTDASMDRHLTGWVAYLDGLLEYLV